MTGLAYSISVTVDATELNGPSYDSVHGLSCVTASAIWLRVRSVATTSFEGTSEGESASSKGESDSPASKGAMNAGPPANRVSQVQPAIALVRGIVGQSHHSPDCPPPALLGIAILPQCSIVSPYLLP